MKKQKARYYIQDWTGKTCFFGKMFDDFEEAWGYIREQEPDEEAWQEYYVELVPGSRS